MTKRLSYVLLAIALAACSSKKKSSSESDSSKDDTSSTSSKKHKDAPSSSAAGSSAKAPSGLKITGPDVAAPAFLVMGGQLQMLDGDKLTVVDDAGIRDMQVGPDGTIYALGFGGVHVFNDGKLVKMGGSDQFVSAESIAFGPKGEPWTGTYGAVSQFVDNKWVENKAPEDCKLCSNIGIDGKGTIYLAGLDKLAALKAGKWEMIDIKFLAEDVLNIKGFVNVGGTLYVVTSSKIVSMDDDHKKIEVSPGDYGYLSMDDLPHLSANGELACHTFQQFFISTTKGPAEVHTFADTTLKAQHISSFAVDGQGRRWVGTDGGLAILGKDNKPLLTFPPGTLPSRVESIFVFGKGPELPAKAFEIVKGDVKGTLLVNGEPVKAADVQFCDSPSSFMSGPTPCFGQPIIVEGKTDDSGVFHMKEVPRGHYGLAFKDGAKWSISLGGSGCCSKIEAGKEIDMGAIKIKD